MANPEHMRTLKQGAQGWNEWRKTHQGTVADLSGAELRFARLFRADLAGAALSRADFRGANLVAADLSGANLEGADLSGADLSEANVSYANLRGANLGRAKLTRANLAKSRLWFANLSVDDLMRDARGADMTGANLCDADLGCANLAAANLSGAQMSSASLIMANLSLTNLSQCSLRDTHLGQANFNLANLTDTDLTGALLNKTVFSNLDLSQARGLDAVRHAGPSVVGLETLYRSKGKVPESFLRGCGVPEDFIRYRPSVLNERIQSYSSFVSYSHEDKAFARLLHDRLQGQGIRCWLDEHQLLPGDDLHEGIDRGIRLWDKVLFCASKASLTSWWVDGEINRAFQKEAQLMKERGKKVLALIPLNLDGFLFSTDFQSGKKAEITSRVAANFVGWEKDRALFDRELQKVIHALRVDDGGREKAPQPKL